MYVHAQRNLDEKIEKNHTLLVRNDEFMRIQGNRMDTVEQNLTARVGHNVDEQIGGDHRSRIGQNRHHTVDGADYEVVKGSQMTSIEERLGVQVREGYSLMIGDAKAPRSADVFAWSDYALGAGGKIRLTAKGGISLRCGDSSIEVTKDGITIKGPVISMSGAKAVKMAGKGPALTLGDEAELTAKVVRVISSKSSLVLDDSAHLDGKNVLLNCKGTDPQASTVDGKPPETQHLSLKLTDPEFKPYANKEYMLTAGGVSFEGTTGGDGKIELDIPKEADVAQIIVFVGGRPDGKKQRYQISLAEFPDASSVRGAQLRLKNLGYFWGEPGDQIDAQTGRALREFQQDHGLEVTGKLDAPTTAKLSDAHGH